MTKRSVGILVALVAAAVAAVAVAGEEPATITASGNIVCAKCTLKKADASECQSMFVADSKEYYLVANEVTEKFGHVCGGSKAAVATGTVEEKDGKSWLTVTKLEPAK